MPDTLLERHYRDRVESLRQMIVPRPDNGTHSRHDYDDLVALCQELAAAGVALLEQEYKRAFQEQHPTVRWLCERRQVIEALSAGYLDVAAAVEAEAAKHGMAAQLEAAMQAVRTARGEILRRWPVGSDEEIAAAQSAAAQRDAVDIDEAFAQIAGVDVGTWRRRIEEFKRQPQS
jgi:hypothetical protein